MSLTIDKIQKAQLARKRDETCSELHIIQKRINQILLDYDEEDFSSPSSNIEFINDIKELEAILSDSVLKAKYQQKVTVFLVGFQEHCTTRKKLLSQIFEFFDTYATDERYEDVESDSEQLDLSQMFVTDAIDSMETSASRLGELNHDIMKYIKHLHQVAANKKNKNLKKLEKAIQSAKNDLAKANDKLTEAEQTNVAKDDTIKILNKQMDAKNKEILKFKTQIGQLKTECSMFKQSAIDAENNRDLLATQFELIKSQHADEMQKFIEKIQNTTTEKIKGLLNRCKADMVSSTEYFTGLSDEKVSLELEKHFTTQLHEMEQLWKEERTNFSNEYKQIIQQELEIEVTDSDLKKWSERTDGSEVGGRIEDEDAEEVLQNKEYEEKLSSEEQMNDLADDDLDDLSIEELKQKFKEYRDKIAMKTGRKSHADDVKYENERIKWETERQTFVKHIQQLKALQEAAEADAEDAMQQLEELAKMQEEEGGKQDGFTRETSSLIMATSTVEDSSNANETTSDTLTYVDDNEQKPLSSISRRSMANIVLEKMEEKRAARLKRQQSVSNIIETTQQQPDFGYLNRGNPESNMRKIYELASEVKGKLCTAYERTKTKDNAEQEDLVISESILKILNDMSSVIDVERAHTPVSRVEVAMNYMQDGNTPVDIDAHQLRMKITQLENDLESTRFNFEQRMNHDSQVIKELQMQSSIEVPHSRNGQNNVPNPTPLTTVYPPMDGGGDAPQMYPPSTAAPTIMFTRLDVEHNTKTIKKSENIGKISSGAAMSLVGTMQAYSEIPATRMRNLANKLVHHVKMKEVETNVRNSNLVTAEVFLILEKMEALQRHRAHEWSRRMDELSRKRTRLGLLLQEAMERLEKTTGVFLIKPVLSYQNPNKVKGYTGKISTSYNKYQLQAMNKLEKNYIVKADAYKHMSDNVSNRPTTEERTFSVFGLSQSEQPVMWNKDSSVAHTPKSASLQNNTSTHGLSTAFPKILELDVNRYLHEVNKVITSTSAAYKRRSHGSLRTYTGINRAQVTPSPIKSPRADTTKASPNESVDYQSTAPPTTPASLARNLNSVTPLLQPLPPILRSGNNSRTSSNFSGSPTKFVSPTHTPSPEKTITKRDSFTRERIEVFPEGTVKS